MHFPLLPTLAAAALLAAGCTAPLPVPRPATGPAVVQMPAAERALHSLGRERREFLCTGAPEAVFAVFYYHVTAAILERVKTGRVEHGAVVLEMLAEFHASYLRSRTPSTREPHWAAYYEKAAKLSARHLRWTDLAHPCDFLHPRGLVMLGVCAHIDGDLPGCLARVLRRHPEILPAELAAAFRSLDDLFGPCAAAGFHDLSLRSTNAPGPALIALQSRLGRILIQRKRHRAWRAATGPR